MIGRSALAGLFIAASSCVAVAADWVERPYNPQIGSRWIIESKGLSEEGRGAAPRTVTTSSRGELTVEEKTVDGFRISYVSRGTTVDGNSPYVELLREIVEIMDGVVVRAQTDAAGRPVRIENLEEVRGMMRAVIARMKARFASKPAVAETIEKIMTNMLMVDEARAAQMYIDDMPLLVMGQQTGLTVGEIRRSVEEIPSPLGGGTIKSNITLQIVNADPATGKARLLRTSAFDVPSVKEMTLKLAKQLMVAAGKSAKPGEIDEIFSKMDISMNGRTEIDVEDGMTRRVHDRSDMRASVMGRTHTKRETKTVTVTPAR